MPSPDYALTTRYNLRALKGDSNISDIDTGFLTLANDVEGLMAGYRSGTAALRIASTAYDGQLWRDVDGTKQLWIGNGSIWLPQLTATRGNTTIAFANTTIATPATVSHGLGVTPTAVLLTDNGNTSPTIFVFSATNLTGTTFDVHALATATFNGSKGFSWLAVA